MGTEQKVVVLTGASQGFGGALVKAYRDRLEDAQGAVSQRRTYFE
jgi:NADP-dependent 3-hydroxy acid dehydrogenase YdfG